MEFVPKHGRLVDDLNQPYMLLWASKQWVIMLVNILSSIIIFVTGAAGLVLTYAATITENMLCFVQVYAIIQQNLTSVEHIVEYNSTEREETGSIYPHRVPQDQPI